MGKYHLLIIASYGYRSSVENVELSPGVQHNASSDDNSKTPSIRDVTEMKVCPASSLQINLAFRITRGTETTLIRKEVTTPLKKCPVHVLLIPF
ncbi:hypothetical protein TNCV_5065381 [Trichonephila clavipes]|nr:hypothetical protein TNCV_5065381 [Trichonephila clavipes]